MIIEIIKRYVQWKYVEWKINALFNSQSLIDHFLTCNETFKEFFFKKGKM